MFFRHAKINLLKTIYIGFVSGLISIIIIEAGVCLKSTISTIEFLSILFSNLIIYSSLSFCYLNLITLGETARRIRIMIELYESKNGLSLDEILQRYNAKMVVDLRLARLLSNGEIISKNNRYFIGNSIMYQIGKIYVVAKLILFGKKSEFE